MTFWRKVSRSARVLRRFDDFLELVDEGEIGVFHLSGDGVFLLFLFQRKRDLLDVALEELFPLGGVVEADGVAHFAVDRAQVLVANVLMNSEAS